MSKFFGFDNPIWNFLGKLTDVIILSLLFLLTSLPIFTIGASLTALYRQMFRESNDTEGYVIKGYFKAFKENFKKSTLVWLPCLAFGLFLAGDVYICMKMAMPVAKMLLAFFTILAVLFVFLLHYLFPLLSVLDAGVKKTFYLSFMLVIKEWIKSLFLVFVTLIMVAVGVFVTAPFLMIAPGIITFFHAIIFRGIFEKYGLKEKYEARV